MVILNYHNEFNAAIERSQKFNLATPKFEYEPVNRWLDEKAMHEFPFVIQKEMPDITLADITLQCMSLHYRLLPVIEDWLKCPVAYTIGWVSMDDGSDLFKFDEKFIAEKLNAPKTTVGDTVNIHAWLTFPSMEVLDMSLPTSFAVLQNKPENQGAVLAKHADSITGFSYRPMLVGEDFLFKAGMAIDPLRDLNEKLKNNLR